MNRPHEYGHLYSTNAVPNLVEAASVHSSISTLQMNISTFKTQLQDLEDELHMHQGVVSSVRKMSMDVLGEVFADALVGVLDDKGRRALIDLCLVCKTWRDAAQATHQLCERCFHTIGCPNGKSGTLAATIWSQKGDHLCRK